MIKDGKGGREVGVSETREFLFPGSNTPFFDLMNKDRSYHKHTCIVFVLEKLPSTDFIYLFDREKLYAAYVMFIRW